MKRQLTHEEIEDALRLKAVFVREKASRGFTQEDAASALDISQGAVSHYLNGKNALNLEAAIRFAAFLGVRVDQFSPRLAKKLPASIREPSPRYSLDTLSPWDDSTPMADDEVAIPFFKEVELAAGAGASHAVELNHRKLRFSRATLAACGVDEANAACATLRGNSMERLISDGSTIGIDRGRTEIRDGEIYAIDHDGMLRVKYLYRLPAGALRLRSENASEYPDEILTADQAAAIRVLGWVFWWSTIRTWKGR